MDDAARADWSRMFRLLDTALELSDDERAGWLERLDAANEPQLPALRQLLAHRASIESAGFLAAPPPLPPNLEVTAGDATGGDVIGGWRLLKVVGSGGMGQVWLAERADGAYQRRAALKLPHAAPGTRFRALDQRLLRERDILAALDHPHIARLYDAGVAAGGRPFIALEFVEGERIDAWCDRQGLDLRARLALFVDVLQAVQHAHARLVVHRDLKPANILVTAAGSVKLLDFGIAKLAAGEGRRAEDSALTRDAGRALTPEYAAPEQLLGQAVGVAADVYALGVVLYELLCGARPYRPARESAAALEEAIVAADVERPSERVTAVAAAVRGSTPARLRRQLRGDLDTIVLKALRKAPDERYASASAMADDVQRHLRDEVVLARPESRVNRLYKLVRRRRLESAIVAAAALALLGGAHAQIAVMAAFGAGSALALWQARRAASERDRALALAARNEGVADFVSLMLTEIGDIDAPMTMRERLARAQQLASATAGASRVQRAAIHELLAQYHIHVSDPARAERLLQEALSLLGRGDDAALRARLTSALARCQMMLGRHHEARLSVEAALALAGDDEILRAAGLQQRAYLAFEHDDLDAYLADIRGAQRLLETAPVPKPLLEADLQADLALGLAETGATTAAEGAYAAAMRALERAGRAEMSVGVLVRSNWALMRLAAGDAAGALAAYNEVMAVAARRDLDDANAGPMRANRGTILERLDRLDEALADFERAAQVGRENRVAFALAIGLAGQGRVLLRRGRLAEADALMDEVRLMVGRDFPAGSTPALNVAVYDAMRLAAQERSDEAVAAFDPVIAHYAAMRAAGTAARIRCLRAAALLQGGRLEAARAEAEAARVDAERVRIAGAPSVTVGEAALLLARIHCAAGDAAAARACAAAAQADLGRSLQPGHPSLAEAAALAAAG